ncbi:MAG: hypothetical protein U9R42_13850 [Bacteroidota bacterium]|nr:hypothetical protein [Bacteroidota bacterium]
MKTNVIFVTMLCISLLSCNKEDVEPNNNNNNNNNATAALAFADLTFNTTNAYFSTNGSMTSPVDSNQAKTITDIIDITFIFNYDYTKPGFFDPVARSQEWYWDDYYSPWLSNAVETRYYTTNLTKAKFDDATADQSKIGAYFADTSSIVLAPHGLFPTGSCIGGRHTYSPSSATLSQGQVFGFKNTSSGKRGLLYIRTDQYSGWPIPISSFDTKVDLIREN